MPANLRNVAIIAHVDHGKTTLLDRLLYQSGMFRNEDLDKLAGGQHGLIMDSNDIERERGITIFSKNCEVTYKSEDGQDYTINIIDTPGHADFGGEVERVLRMADGVLLLVDAFEGPMPQTRFVLQKALSHGLQPIVVVNKADRPDARPEFVVDEVLDLLIELEADESSLEFPTIYASARDGWAVNNLTDERVDLRPIFEAITRHVPAPDADPDGTLQLQVATLDFSEYVGRIGIGRVFHGRLTAGQSVAVIDRNGKRTDQRVLKLFRFEGLTRREVAEVEAGDICAVVGLDPINIGDSITDVDDPQPMEAIHVDEPTLHMTFRVNDSPFAGREGEFVTSRQIRARLEKELQSNVALRMSPGATPEEFEVAGRGMLHIGILLENMRREGFELAVGKPKVIYKTVEGEMHEPIERLVIDCPTQFQSAVMGIMGDRRAEIEKMDVKAGAGEYIHMVFNVPARGLIGIRARMLNATQGQCIMHHTFEKFEPMRGPIPQRNAGVMIATDAGRITGYALDQLYDRGVFFVKTGDEVFEGQLVGEHCKDTDLPVNPTKAKALNNVRRATKEMGYEIRAPRELSLEQALEYIQDDELVEITPSAIRLRKRMLKESDRRRVSRQAKGA